MMKKLLLVIFIATFSFLNNVGAQEDNLTGGKSRELLLKKKYLNFPVKNGAKKSLISLIIDGKVVREFQIELSSDEPDFWVFLDIGEFKNQKALLRINKLEPDKSKVFDSVYQADTFKG